MNNMGHAGLQVDPASDAKRQAQGLPVYRPTDPKDIDQTPYLAYLDKEEDHVREMQTKG